MTIEWIEITKFGNAPIGAIGFIDNKAAIVTAYHDDLDGNEDGKAGLGEGSAMVEVAMQARVEMEVIMKDASFQNMATKLYINFTRGLVIDGIYAAYFARGVTMGAKGVCKIAVAGTIKQFAVRKGLEAAVHDAFNASMTS